MTTVGITVGVTRTDLTLSRHYVDAVVEAGGTPVLLPVSHGSPAALLRAVGAVDAILLTNGGDVEPGRYGAATLATLEAVDRTRDELEILTVHAAIDRRKRLLGVCRGAQVMAVATGGTLLQDLPARGYLPHRATDHDLADDGIAHGLKADPESLVGRILADCDSVNSFHHQAIDNPGEILVPTAWSPDGVIEAVEAQEMLGVQWHPEITHARDGNHLALFRWLVGSGRGPVR